MIRSLFRQGGPRVGAPVLALLLVAAPALAVTKWKGIEPGKTGRSAVETTLGAPVGSIPPTLVVYGPQQGTGRVLVDYGGDGVVQRIEVELTKPVSRAALVKNFKLEEFQGLRKPEPDGTLAEYFGAAASLILFYRGADDESGVTRIGFCGRERFEQLVGPLVSGGRAPSAAPTDAANPVDADLIIESLDPTACRDIYLWAQSEEQAAKRSHNATRRQRLLDILIASQKGACEHARTEAAAYKSAYSRP